MITPMPPTAPEPGTTRSRRFRRLLGAAVGAVLTLAGCASSPTGRHTDPPRTGGSFQPMGVLSARLVDSTRLAVVATVPGPDPTCVTDPTGDYDEDARTVFVQLRFTSAALTTARCAQTADMEFTVAIPPLRGRYITVDGGKPWRLTADGRTFAECGGPFGCDPPADHCDDRWMYLLGHSGELPPERTWTVRACTPKWAVLDITATVTGCQPLDGRTPPAGCRSSRHRGFFEWDATGRNWSQLPTGTGEGCAPVAAIPRFPRSLCSGLPAVN
jgi:hypothetical protein